MEVPSRGADHAVHTPPDLASGAGTAERHLDPAGTASHRSRAWWFAVALALVCVAIALATVWLALLNGQTPGQIVLGGTAAIAGVSLSFAGVGALVAARRPGHPLGWLFLVAAAFQGLIVLATEYGVHALVTRPGSLPLGPEATWLKEWIWAPGLGLILVFLPLLFPDGRPPSRRWWPVAWLGGLAVGLCSTLLAVPLWPARGPALLPEEAEFAVAPSWALLLDAVAVPLLLLASLTALGSLVVRLRRATGTERAQIAWFLSAAALTLAFVAAVEAMPRSGEAALQALLAILGLVVLPSIPIAVGVSIIGHRLYGIDLVVNRTLVYAALIVVVTTGYVVVVASVGALVSAEGAAFAPLVAAAVVAVVFAPLRTRLQRAANRLMYGDRDDPYTALSRLARQVERAAEPRAVLRAVAETVARGLRVPHVAVETAHDGRHEVAAEVGAAVGRPLVLLLAHGGREVGRLRVSPRRPDEAFSPAERRLLADLARQASTAVHSVQLSLDLQRSRERLVGAREEERRRLRRTLHDEVGPALSSAVLKLAAVRRLVTAGSPADGLLDELRSDLRATVGDVRALAYDLRPPALDQLGLPQALAEFVEARRDAGEGDWTVRVSVDADLPSLPAAAEVAAYWIAREALTNAARHAGAALCRVGLALEGPHGQRELLLEVTDDGTGISQDAVPGVGMAAMRERAQEMGGSLTVTSSADGTLVTARLPVVEVSG